MPGGADVAYPGGKRRLHEQVKASGLVVSEMPPGMRPFRWSFPARNRIMAALARMTVVVEGTEGSGSLITAGFAQDLGREVGAVPGQATSPLAAGPNRLLSEGAAVVRSASDVLDALFGPGGIAPGRPRRRCGRRPTRRWPRVWSRGCAGCSSPSRPGSGRSRAWPKGRTSPRCWPACRSSSSWGSSGVGPVETMCAVSDRPSQAWARAYSGGAMPSAPSTTPRVLSIAGSDSGGGAGIQADLKAFASCGVHGMTAITAVTWQNTVAVTGVTPIPPEAILGQVRAVADDIGVDAVKIGMLGSVETVEAVRAALGLLGDVPVVLDPVMVAASGASLLEPDARRALIDLLPAATVITPNLLEARALADEAEVGHGETPEELAAALGALGPRYVVVTGGHVESADVVDLFWDGEHAVEIPGPAVSRRVGARLGLHPLLRACCSPRAGPGPARGGGGSQAGRLGGRAGRAHGHRRGPGAGRRARHRSAPAHHRPYGSVARGRPGEPGNRPLA